MGEHVESDHRRGRSRPVSSEDDPVVDEVTITRMRLRTGGWIGYTEEGLYVDRGDKKIKVRNDDVVRITLRTVEWDHLVMSLLLVAVGGYVGATRNPLVGAGFALVGVWSLYRTYEDRYKLLIRVQGRTKPLTLYPEYPTDCHETLADRLDLR